MASAGTLPERRCSEANPSSGAVWSRLLSPAPTIIVAVRPDDVPQRPAAAIFPAAKELGCDGVLWTPGTSAWALDDRRTAEIVDACGKEGLPVLIGTDLARMPLDHPLVASHPELFDIATAVFEGEALDPRGLLDFSGEARARLASHAAAELLTAPLSERLVALAGAGLGGFVLPANRGARAGLVAKLLDQVRSAQPQIQFWGQVSSDDEASLDQITAGHFEGFITPGQAALDLGRSRSATPLLIEPGRETSR